MANVDLKAFLRDRLAERGIPEVERGTYILVLQEVADYLQTAPAKWKRADLEQFLRVRAPLLGPQELPVYGAALAFIDDLVTSMVASGQVPRIEQEAALTGLGAAISSTVEDGDFLSETLDRISARRRVETPVPRSIPARRQAPADEIDFLSENMNRWRERTSRHQSLSDRPDTRTKKRQPARFERTESQAETGQAKVRASWNPRGWIELRWDESLRGDLLHEVINRASETVAREKGVGLLANMADSRVLSPEDAVWFGEWMKRSTAVGVERFAAIRPRNAIARMQLKRLLDEGADLATRVFDDAQSARDWLGQR